MSTGAKIAIGCVVVVFLAMMAAAVGVVGLGWYAKSKVEKFTGDETRLRDLQKKAEEAGPRFTQPADGVLQEDRLLKFLEIRKRVYGVYEQHKAELEAIGQKKQGDLGDVTKAFGFIGEIRSAQAQAQADVGMGNDEYRYYVETVYKTLWASEAAKGMGGKSVSEGLGQSYSKAAEEMEKGAQAIPPGAMTPEQQKAMADAVAKMREQAGSVQENAKSLDVPPANVELFRKHEAEIKKYAMSGLELIGL